MNQKGFANIVLIVVIVAIVAVGGYFVFSKKSATPIITITSPKPNDRVSLALPKLKLYEATHFTISLPEGWDIKTPSENGDQVNIYNPKEPDVSVSVFTLEVNNREGRWPKMEERPEFSGRHPVLFKGDDGREGIAAEGSHLLDPTKQILAVGYQVIDGLGKPWDMWAWAVAPKEQFESMKPLFITILKSLKPDPAK